MRRMQVVELEDFPWFPRAIRDGGTDWLGFMANLTRAFSATAPLLRRAMEATSTTNVLDLCSGGGGPWLTLEPELRKSGEVTVELSDLFPNAEGLGGLRARSGGRVGFRPESVDATDVPPSLDGVRTMFNCFHHFPEPLARAILADAVRKRRGIAIFEGFDSRLLPILGMPLQFVAVLLLTPFVRPFRWSRLALTYLVPLIPLLVWFDGTMSMLRLYLVDELRELVASVPGSETYTWEIGTTPVPGLPTSITHLVGIPKPVAP